jgi:predicted small metal-binding protein
MKQFACGDVVPGCTATFTGSSVDDILGQVAAHARDAHAMASVPSDVVEHVTAAIR